MRMIDDCRYYLAKAGFAADDADALRRISMTLHRWHELECGDSNDWVSVCLVRGWKENGAFRYSDHGKPYLETHYHNSGDGKAKYIPTSDREKGALKRLAKIMAKYPGFEAYVQSDPRGCALYILRPDDMAAIVAAGSSVDSMYNRGIAVHK